MFGLLDSKINSTEHRVVGGRPSNVEPENDSDKFLRELKMKYLPDLADDSEIRKNRALIDDLRANLRKSTLSSLKKISHNAAENDSSVKKLNFNFLDEQVHSKR